jgi:hypothetical protein
MATTISKCHECGFRGNDNFCHSIECKVFIIRKFGEVLDFSNGTFRFSPKIGSSLQSIVFHSKTFDEVVDFLYPQLADLYRKGVK